MAIWPPKLQEVLISLLELRQIQRQSWVFDHGELDKSAPNFQAISTVTDTREWKEMIFRKWYLAISGDLLLPQHLTTLLPSSSWSKIRVMRVEFRRYASYFRSCKYFRFLRFRRLFVVVGRWWNGLRTHSSISLWSKSQVFRWSLDHTFGDISTSGLGGHIAISGCHLSSK